MHGWSLRNCIKSDREPLSGYLKFERQRRCKMPLSPPGSGEPQDNLLKERDQSETGSGGSTGAGGQLSPGGRQIPLMTPRLLARSAWEPLYPACLSGGPCLTCHHSARAPAQSSLGQIGESTDEAPCSGVWVAGGCDMAAFLFSVLEGIVFPCISNWGDWVVGPWGGWVSGLCVWDTWRWGTSPAHQGKHMLPMLRLP